MTVLQYHTDASPEQQAESMQLLREEHYDLLHIHGCWSRQAWTVARLALKKGSRLVFSPEGQLQPWVMKNDYWKEKLLKRLLYQRWIANNAYAVIVQGKMEEECLRQLGWNTRLIIIRNPEITNTITYQEAERQQQQVYRKVMNSNPLELMTVSTRQMLRLFIKAGITGDKRWIDEDLTTIEPNEWHKVLCFGYQEGVMDFVKRGIRVLNYDLPDFDVSKEEYFVPDTYEELKSIEQSIGSSFVSENDRLLATFRYLRKLWQRRHLTIAHLAELDKELRFHECNEERLREDLQERGLMKFASRLMQLMNELTGLTEGFMPIYPLNDRLTRQMRKAIDNHLKI